MEKISHKVVALGGVISTTDISSEAEYKRIHRAAQRGELLKLRSGVYASPDALLDTMLDIERIVPGGVVCLYNAWSHYHHNHPTCILCRYRKKAQGGDSSITSYYPLLLERRISIARSNRRNTVRAYSSHYQY